MAQKFRPNNKNVSVFTSSNPSQITKSFFRRNGKHLDKESAVELFKQDVLLAERLDYNYSIVSVFGSARVSNNFYKNFAQAAYDLAYLLGKEGFVISTGGGPGIMEFASRGAVDANSTALGFQPKFIEKVEGTVSFDGKIHYLVYSLHSRKILMAKNASSFVFFPGGAGTIDELFHYLNFAQNGWIKDVKFILFGSEFWNKLVNWFDKNLVQRGLVEKNILKNIILTDSIQEAKNIIVQNRTRASYYCPKPKELSENFEEDIKQLYSYIEKLSHPSAAFFGTIKTKNVEDLAKYLSKQLHKSNYTIYYFSLNGLQEFFKSFASHNSKNISFEIPLKLLETKKLILGSTDKLFFLNSDLECVDALTEYVVRIQMGDMEKVEINLLEPNFWRDYLKWFWNYPINYGFAEEELIKLFNIINSKKDIKALGI
ncbi:MAG: TIGR00730 family Rossman fold protein [Candidatus Anstonellaceae archaeon]